MTCLLKTNKLHYCLTNMCLASFCACAIDRSVDDIYTNLANTGLAALAPIIFIYILHFILGNKWVQEVVKRCFLEGTLLQCKLPCVFANTKDLSEWKNNHTASSGSSSL